MHSAGDEGARPSASTRESAGCGDGGDGGPTTTRERPSASTRESAGCGDAGDGGPNGMNARRFANAGDGSSGRKNLVERLHQQRTEAVSALVANIAHDVRNPLSAMLFNLESLNRCACDSPDIRESIQGIRDATGILCRIVDGLVDFAALGPPREGIPIARVLDRLKSLLRGVLRAGNHTMEVVVDPSIYCVQIHPLTLEQVLASLVMNALDANPAGTAVRLRVAPHGPLPDDTDRQFVRIEVENRGAAIPPFVEARLFEPFFSTKPEGTGLGLATAREALRGAGGDVWHTPSTGGVRFDLIVPAGKAGRKETEAGR
jgi:signal transduction histidine kinase